MSLSAKPDFYRLRADVAMSVEGRVPRQVLARLKEMGHTLETTDEFAIGNMQGILMNPKTGTMTAGADPRRMMYAAGW